MKPKHLDGKAKGVVDYDYKNDILFFKIKERDYLRSIELENIVIDLDRENFIVGIQIFDASKFLNISKENLLKIPRWEFNAKIHNNVIEVRLTINISIRNKIVEMNPIIMQPIMGHLPDSEMVCATA